jgi:hypothetical protein
MPADEQTVRQESKPDAASGVPRGSYGLAAIVRPAALARGTCSFFLKREQAKNPVSPSALASANLSLYGTDNIAVGPVNAALITKESSAGQPANPSASSK